MFDTIGLDGRPIRWNMNTCETLLVKAFVALHAHVQCVFATAYQFATVLSLAFLQIVAVTVIAYVGYNCSHQPGNG